MKKIILQSTLLLLYIPTTAQYTFNNTGSLQIHTGASVTAFGNFTNTSTATLVNNSSFYIKGNITNDQSAMTTGTGALYLNGTVAQAVNGTQPFKTFMLVTDNTAGITLNNNLSVADVHTYAGGIITTSATPDYLVYEAGSSYSGDNDNAHVNGWVKKLGSTGFAFPVGNGTYERKVSVTNLSASLEFDCHYRAPTANKYNILSPLLTVDPNEYWEITGHSSGTAQVVMNWDNSKVPIPDYILTDIKAARYNGSVWTDIGGSATGNVYTTGTITSNVTGSFGNFTFGSYGWAVPLKFVEIAAERKQSNTLVQWKTVHEYNVDRFEVERSNNAVTFQKTGSVAALNNAAGSQYSFTDIHPLQGTAWYRIRSVDIDGNVSFSAIAAVSENNNPAAAITLLNNPVQHTIYLSAPNAYNGAYDYKLFNSSGQQVQSGQLQFAGNIISIPLSFTITPGTYTLVVQNDQRRFSEKIVVQ